MGSNNLEAEIAKRRAEVVVWLNSLFPDLKLPLETTERELRVQLLEGSIFNDIIRKFNLDAVDEIRFNDYVFSEKHMEYVIRFISVVNELGLPSFKVTDLEKGNLSTAVECLLSLRSHLGSTALKDRVMSSLPRCRSLQNRKWKHLESIGTSLVDNNYGGPSSPVFGENKRSSFAERKFPQSLKNLIFPDKTSTSSPRAGLNIHELFQLNLEQFSELPATKMSEIIKPNSLDNAPTQSLLSLANGLLDESIERQNGELPQRVACLLKKVVQEIERRITTQAEHIRHRSNMMKSREEKYLSRIRVLETLAEGTNEGTQVAKEKNEPMSLGEEEVARLMKEHESSCSMISELKQVIESTKNAYEQKYQQLEIESNITKSELEKKIKEVGALLEESRRRTKELEEFSNLKSQNWNQKEHVFNNLVSFEMQSLQDLRTSSKSIKQEVIDVQNRWREEIAEFGLKLKVLTDAAENYHTVFSENRKLYNEVQELKGNIRVCCRIRPLLPGENMKSTIIDYISENGELAIVNPSKQGKDGQKMFKFSTVFGPTASQEEVFWDIRPLVRSVLDGYNVCIFAYGQTGSGKTYTMSGPNSPSEEEWGVNYRALNDLFHLSWNRRRVMAYEVGVQMIEIYNEQVRDLLANDPSQKRLGIVSTSQSNGLAVPDASMHSVNSTSDVLELMQIGLANRAMSATALNQRSSRSHSIVTIHVRGTDLKAGSTLYGSLHLVDLAGSERVDRSEVTGDRLKEAQHINKSLSALGDVIFSLSQKSAHIPYRNSKLTQVLQSSLGGHAKTLMFVQINPDVNSFAESLSTLKFAERVSGVELGAARSNREGKDVKDLMEEVALLKETIAKKDKKIEHLQMITEAEKFSSGVNSEKKIKNILRHSSSSPGISSKDLTSQHGRGLSAQKMVTSNNKAAFDSENNSDYSDRHSDISSECRSKHSGEETGMSCQADAAEHEILGVTHFDLDERISDVYNGHFLESNDSVSDFEFSLLPKQSKSTDSTKEKMTRVTSRVVKPLQTKVAQATSVHSKMKDSSKSLNSSATKGALKRLSSKDSLKSPSIKEDTTLLKRWQ